MSSIPTSFSNTITQGPITSLVNVTSSGTDVTTQNGNTVTKVTFNYDSTLVEQYVNKIKTTLVNNQNASIIGLALDSPQYPYGDSYFENVVLMSYIEDIKENATIVPLSNLDTYKYQGDFYGILNLLEIPLAYHPITLRLNGFTDTGIYDTSITSILVPNTSQIDGYAAVYANTVPNPY
jgi:hypothetical protein